MEKLGVSTLAKLCIIACASLQVQIWFVLAVKYADMNYVLQLVQQLCRINLVEFLCVFPSGCFIRWLKQISRVGRLPFKAMLFCFVF